MCRSSARCFSRSRSASREHNIAFSDALSSGRLGKRSEEHTSELQSQSNLVCRLLLEKKKHCHRVLRWATTSVSAAVPSPVDRRVVAPLPREHLALHPAALARHYPCTHTPLRRHTANL